MTTKTQNQSFSIHYGLHCIYEARIVSSHNQWINDRMNEIINQPINAFEINFIVVISRFLWMSTNCVLRVSIHPHWWKTTYRVYAKGELRPRQNGRHFPDDIFKWIFLNQNIWISINISLKFVPMGPINNIPALVQIMAWRCPGDKPLSEPMMVSLPTHICVAQWVKAVVLKFVGLPLTYVMDLVIPFKMVNEIAWNLVALEGCIS